MRSILPVVVAIFCAAFGMAQSTGDARPQCSVSGTVTDSATGQPIKGAEVIVRSITPRMGLPLRPASATSDANGEFAIETLDPGRYAVRAFHDGYVFKGTATILTLSPGQRVENISVSLTPGGIISGHVVDESGKVLAGTSVELMKYSFANGRRDLNVVSNVSTNKSGEYRMEGLQSGQYFLRASVPTSGKPKQAADGKVYVPIYFPNATDLTHAATLDVKPAQELAGIDLNMAPVRGMQVAGLVIDSRSSVPKAGAEVTLLSDEGYTTLPGGQVATDQKGHFEFYGIAPGAYVVVAQSPTEDLRGKTFWGKLTLNVEENNVSNLKLLVSAGQTVSGRLRAESNSGVESAKLSISLESLEPSAISNLLPEGQSATVNADGNFRLEEVPDGTYSLSFSSLPQGTYLKSVGASDVLENGIVVGNGQVPAVDLVLAVASARVDGTATASDNPVPGALAVLVPDGKRRTQFSSYRVAQTDKTGRFSLRSIPPGDYKLFAWEGVTRREFMNPDFLRQYEDQGKALHLEDGSKEDVQIQVISVNDGVQ